MIMYLPDAYISVEAQLACMLFVHVHDIYSLVKA